MKMKKIWKFYTVVIVLLGIALSCFADNKKGYETDKKKNQPKRIIFDTDMGPDYDDIGAIAVLHALFATGECEVLATISSTDHSMIAPTIEAYNLYYGHNELPIGVPAKGAPNFTSPNNWNDTIVNGFAPQLIGKQYPQAVSVYRKVLAEQPDNSVTIVTVGFVSNVSDLLNSQADEYSDLNGVDLVRLKVKEWVAMAGGMPEGREFNVFQDSVASVNAFSKWPKPILFSGFEIGAKIFTGSKVAQKDAKTNPVARGYAYNLKNYTKEGEIHRPSWDQTTVLVAIRKPEDYFYVNGPGKFIINKDGSNTWDANTNAEHYFLTHKFPYQYVADVLEELMSYEPK